MDHRIGRRSLFTGLARQTIARPCLPLAHEQYHHIVQRFFLQHASVHTKFRIPNFPPPILFCVILASSPILTAGHGMHDLDDGDRVTFASDPMFLNLVQQASTLSSSAKLEVVCAPRAVGEPFL